MKNISTSIIWLAVVLIAALSALNRSTMMAVAPINLLVAQVQAPLGVVLLGTSCVLFALFFVAYLRNQIGSLLETRKLLKEVQRVQKLADQAESSRMESLHTLIETKFRLLDERLTLANAAMPMPAEPAGSREFRPLSLMDMMTRREHH